MKTKRRVEDPVAVYDTMREAASRVVGEYAARITVGGVEDPMIQKIRELRAEIRSVDTEDVAAQRSVTLKMRGLHERLSAGDMA